MKKPIVTTLVTVFVFLTNIAVAQTLDEILNNHFKAIGQDKLTAAKSVYIKANVNQMGNDIQMEMKVKRPDKLLINMEMQGQKITQAFDGEKGWMIVPGMGSEPQELTGEMLAQLKQQPESIIESDFYNYKEKGSTIDFIGKVNADSNEAYRIKLTTSDGNTNDYFIDTNTYLIKKILAKVSSGGQSVEVEQKLSDYKTIDGITMPLKIEQNSPVGIITIAIDEIRFNENFDDSIFEQPLQ